MAPWTHVPTSLARHARRHVSALRLERALARGGSYRDAVARAGKLHFDGRSFLVQAPEEILWLLDRVGEARPRRVVEIGTAHGGTLYLWSLVAAPDSVLVAVDSTPLGRLGRWEALARLCRSFARERQRVELVFGAPSQSDATRRRVEAALGGEPVDFLFIDGDHSYGGVRADFELYSPLVRPGGMVAFHDIAPRVDAGTGVPRFWEELSATHEVDQVVASTEPSFGIGILRVPGAA
jgi:predicted O-methyltransferase YrrM